MIRDAVHSAAHFLAETVAKVPAHKWDALALGEWSARDLAGHASRGLTTIVSYAEKPALHRDITTTAGYYHQVFDPSRGYADPKAIAQRGRDAGRDLGSDPSLAVQRIVAESLAALARMADAAILTTPFGTTGLLDYLPTRVVEVTIHTIDLARATGVDATPPRDALALTLHTLADVALVMDNALPIIFAITGRAPLPPRFSLLP